MRVPDFVGTVFTIIARRGMTVLTLPSGKELTSRYSSEGSSLELWYVPTCSPSIRTLSHLSGLTCLETSDAETLPLIRCTCGVAWYVSVEKGSVSSSVPYG